MVRDVYINNELFHELSIENEYIKFSCLDYGATITRLETKDKNGEFTSNILTYEDYNDYYHNSPFLGACVAPLPGRIKNHKVEIDGTEYILEANDGNNTLHSGENTLAFKRFDYEVGEDYIKLTHLYEDLSCGVPGDINFTVKYTLKDNSVVISYQAISSENTYFSATNHTYFNLGGSLLDHELFIDSNYFLALDEDYAGSNKMVEVVNTGHDFRKLTKIEQIEKLPIDSSEKARGLDHAYLLFDGENCIKLVSKESGKVLTLSTDEESVVVYTGNYLDETMNFKGFKGTKHAGVAFEPQAIPNGMNTKLSDSWYLKKDTLKESTTTLTFDLCLE